MRLKLTAPLQSRDGTLTKGGLMQNAFAEIDGETYYAKKRFAISLVNTNTALAVIDTCVSIPDTDTILLADKGGAGFHRYSIDTVSSSVGTFSALPSYVAYAGEGEYVFILGNRSGNVIPYLLKSSSMAWYCNSTDLTPVVITDVDYPGMRTVSVTSITRAGSVATVTTTTPHGFASNTSATIAGAIQTEYNGTFTITVTGTTTFTYAVSGTPATPATGTITVVGGRLNVYGGAFLDGYWFVMDTEGTIYNSDLENPASWNSLNFINCENAPDGGSGIARYQNYIVGFGFSSMEFFYDAANPTGSPLARVPNASQDIGCADPCSIATMPNGIAFVGRSKGSSSVSVYSLTDGFVPVKISTPDVEKVLKYYFTPATTTAYGVYVCLDGNPLYILTVQSSKSSTIASVTLAYDFSSQSWATIKLRRIALASKSVSTLTQENGLATCTLNAAYVLNFSGNIVTIAGATPAGFNGTFYLNKVSDTVFTFPCDASLSATATGTITASLAAAEIYPNMALIFPAQSSDVAGVFEDVTNCYFDDSSTYRLDLYSFQDYGSRPIDVVLRTTLFDGGTQNRKFNSSAEIVGDKTTGSKAIARWSDDDYTTYSDYREVDLSVERSRLSRLGSFSRRAYEIRHSLNTAFRVEALEIEVN